MTDGPGEVFRRFRAAGSDRSRVVLEGFHALKHAVRFGAEVEDVVTPDLVALHGLAAELAPDLTDYLTAHAAEVPRELFRQLTVRPPASPVLSIAATRRSAPAGPGRTVVLYDPRHAGNIGAVIRVAAAAGAGAVVVVGELDPWSPAVVRASAGLHFALSVQQADWPLTLDRPLVAWDAQGTSEPGPPPDTDAVYLFGSERHGLPEHVLAAASEVRRIPMRPGVSSLNLATSVAVALYAVSSSSGRPA